MAYFLSKTSSISAMRGITSSAIEFCNKIDPSWSGDWEIEFKIRLTGSSFILLSENTSDSGAILFFTSLTTLELRRPSSSNTTFALLENASGLRTYRIVGSLSPEQVEVFQDGVSCGTTTESDLFDINWFFTFSNTSRTADLYTLKFYKDGVLEHEYENTSGTGAGYPDVVGSNDITLESAPLDDSQWVFYSTGPNTPINPSITNLLATSARLNWEQG